MGITDNNIECVPATRMERYRSSLVGESISDKLKKQAEHLETRFDIVENLLDIGKKG